MYKSTPPDRPPVLPLGSIQKDMHFITDTLCLLRSYVSSSDSVKSILSTAIEKSRSLAFSCIQLEPSGQCLATIGVGDGSGSLFVHGTPEAVKRVQGFILDAEKWRAGAARSAPVEYEYRACPHWDDRWTEWRSCPKEIAEEYRQCPDVHGWRYEIREVPRIPRLNTLLDEIAEQIREQSKKWPLAAYEESALIVESYKEAEPGYLPCADQCGNAVPVGGDPICHQCRSEIDTPDEGDK